VSNTSEQIAAMVDILPDTEQLFALELVKRLVLAWDPDYTKVTEAEAEALDAASEDFERGEYIRHDEINWTA